MVTKMACADAVYKDAYTPGYVVDPGVQGQVSSTLQKLSLTEKADQMRGTDPGNGQFHRYLPLPDNTSKGIKGFLFRDGPRGVNLDAALPSGTTGGKSTVFPVPMARGASWDFDLELRIGEAMGDEMVASGQTMLLAPTTNILRHPLWGRAQETYGEDAFQLGRFGSASVVGIQEYVPACAKHYAANNIENGRATANAQMDEQALHEVYARHFQMMIARRGRGVHHGLVQQGQRHERYPERSPVQRHSPRRSSDSRASSSPTGGRCPAARTIAIDTSLRKTTARAPSRPGWTWSSRGRSTIRRLEAIVGAPLTETDHQHRGEPHPRAEVPFQGRTKPASAIGLKSSTTTPQRGSINSPAISSSRSRLRQIDGAPQEREQHAAIDKTKVKSIAVIGASLGFHVTSPESNGTIDFAADPRTGDLGSSRVNADSSKSVGPFDGIKAAAGSGITVTKRQHGRMLQPTPISWW